MPWNDDDIPLPEAPPAAMEMSPNDIAQFQKAIPVTNPKKPQFQQKGRRRRAAYTGSAVFGNEFEEDSVPMNSIAKETTAVVEGEVISAEATYPKDGMYTRVLFTMTDFTTTLNFKVFVSGKHDEHANMIRPGKCFKIRGKYDYDDFARDMLFTVSDMVAVEKKKVSDNAPEKRVELHLHTTMSAQDGLCSAKKYISRASEWGHKANRKLPTTGR